MGMYELFLGAKKVSEVIGLQDGRRKEQVGSWGVLCRGDSASIDSLPYESAELDALQASEACIKTRSVAMDLILALTNFAL